MKYPWVKDARSGAAEMSLEFTRYTVRQSDKKKIVKIR
jgi:hypothetical protein